MHTGHRYVDLRTVVDDRRITEFERGNLKEKREGNRNEKIKNKSFSLAAKHNRCNLYNSAKSSPLTINHDIHTWLWMIESHEPIGQTFTATDSNIGKISFSVQDGNALLAPLDYSLTMEVFEGVGVSGTSLGTVDNNTNLVDGFHGFLDFDYSFASFVTGLVYTAAISNDTKRWGVNLVEVGNPYTPGNLMRVGMIEEFGDMTFRIAPAGAVPEPVPEPASIALLGIGLAGLAGAEVRRRRKKKAVD